MRDGRRQRAQRCNSRYVSKFRARFIKSLLRPSALGHIYRQCEQKARRSLDSPDDRNAVAHPDQATIFSPRPLLELKLLSFSLNQLHDERAVEIAVIFDSDVDKRELFELIFRITHHFLEHGIRRQKATVEIGKHDTDG